MNKEDVIHICSGTLSSHKKEWNNAICSNMDGSRNYHTKWSKPERERQIHDTFLYFSRSICKDPKGRVLFISQSPFQNLEGWHDFPFQQSREHLRYSAALRCLSLAPSCSRTLNANYLPWCLFNFAQNPPKAPWIKFKCLHNFYFLFIDLLRPHL